MQASTCIQKEEVITCKLQEAKDTDVPTVIEFIIEREENVLPIVPPGKSLRDMIIHKNHENYFC